MQRRARYTLGNRLSASCHLQRPVSPLHPVRKRGLFIGSSEENTPSKRLRESVELPNDGVAEPLDNHSVGSDTEVSVYEDFPDSGTDSDHPSDVFSSESDSEFILPENINDDTAWTGIERKLMAKLQHLQTANDDLLLQVSLKLQDHTPHGRGIDVHAHITNLQRQRDEYLREIKKSRANENQLMSRLSQLLSRITQLESEKVDRDLLELRNQSLLALNNTLRGSVEDAFGRLTILAGDLRSHL